MTKYACALATLLCVSCSSTKTYLHPDQSITISSRNAFTSWDHWISPTDPGTVTPASKIKLGSRENIKVLGYRPIKCEGFIDRTKDGTVLIQLAIEEQWAGRWKTFYYNGTHRLIEESSGPES
ncbi:hypothetical protein OKA04_01110 [Luteolibacter flavescens]|uniref:Lipoprotein n=1 Tax=Luteolibacter flavescens TaxID=1859460 RepID=A0ABT3FIB3_9BACT|nr:hypothetical protein [Luteolibacter flavescens]MCW1883307.1 hypothetical protein [Luteolibacter flavescens]